MDTIQEYVDALRELIIERCPEAIIVESIITEGSEYDARLTVKVPGNWTISRVTDFQDWARQQAYELFIEHNIDIRIEVYSLTRNQQELVKWIYSNYPSVSTETLPASGITYSKEVAGELLSEHEKRINEGIIEMSDNTKQDRAYIEHKHRRTG